MTQQAKILSFDKARRAQGDRSHSLDSSRYATRDARSSRTGHSSREHSGTYAAARTRRDSDYAARAAERLRYSEDDAREIRQRSFDGARETRSSSRDSRRSASDRGPIGGREYSAQSRDAYADSRLAWDDSLDEEGVEQEELEPETLSRFEKLKRKHAKDKADRKFARQYGGNGDAASGEGGSRAAVYKGEMGSAHRRSSRMQNEKSSSASRRTRGGDSQKAAARLVRKPWFIATAVTAFCLVFTVSFLYPSAAQLYHSVRERDQLQAEYAAIEQRNDSIQASVDALSTDAGVEDRAHQEFGWVSKGENAVTVYGLDLDSDSTFTASIVPGSIPAPETWYSKLLDPIFGEK
ncbi:FtsB family cell division protein [Ellagibacter isourolithinifaciens]|uniref:FtsB family cell division protein n=1 Tax=Ellagibacter isourolithinifaciens TaxID=2137581 RepID=UPI003AAC405E